MIISEMQHKLATWAESDRTGGSIVLFVSLPIGNGLPKPLGSFWRQAAPGPRASTEWISDGCRLGWITIWPICGQAC